MTNHTTGTDMSIDSGNGGTAVIANLVKTGCSRIVSERARQITLEGFSLEHDKKYAPGVLSSAGECYIMYANLQLKGEELVSPPRPPGGWPFEPQWWKPSPDPLVNLTKGAALCAAEIDRAVLPEKA